MKKSVMQRWGSLASAIMLLMAGSATAQSDPDTPFGSLVWIDAEYSLWWTDGMSLPPLVTTNPGAVPDLANPATTVLFGNEDVVDGSRSGWRVAGGYWIDPWQLLGLEGDYFSIGEESASFDVSSDAAGNPILGRPFFNVNPRDPTTNVFDPPARDFAQLVSSPGTLAGAVSVDASSSFESAGARFRYCLGQSRWAGRNYGFNGPNSARLDFLLGYRFLRLDEDLVIRESLTSLVLANPGNFEIRDSFVTENRFHGGEFGVLCQVQIGPTTVELVGKTALGNNRESVAINGSTVITNSGANDGTFQGGLLAQNSNIGIHQRDEFALVSELGLKVARQITSALRITMSYNFVYWSRVLRPGEQVDLDVNPDFLPPPFVPFAGPRRPGFQFDDVDFWAQGLRFGIDCRW